MNSFYTLITGFWIPDPNGLWQISWKSPADIALGVTMRILAIALIFLAARVAVGILRRLITRAIATAVMRAEHGQRRLITLQGLLTSTLSYAIYFIAAILVLFTVGVTWKGLAPLLGVASVLGLAIGFGAQKLVRDVITGLFILGEGQFDVGEWVTIGTVTGQVEDIGLRVTRLRDEHGRIYIIANGDITQVFNASRGLVRLPIDLTLQRATPLDAGLETIRQLAEDTLREAQFSPTAESAQPTVMVVGMDAAKVSVRLVLWVPVLQKELLEDTLRRRLLEAIAQEDTQLALA